MRPRILVVEHQASCPPALFGRWLEEAGAVLDVCRPWACDPLTALLSGRRGLDQRAVLAEVDEARGELDVAWRPLAHRFAELAGEGR